MPGGGGGGGGSGGGFQQTNMNSTQTSGPNPYIAPMLQNIGGNAFDWMKGNMNAPGYFPGGTVAAPGEQTISANTGLAQRGAAQLGYGLNDTSKQELANTIGGQYLDPASNPAYQGWLEASFRPQAEQFRDIVAPSIDSTFAGSGRTAGGAHFDTSMRGYQDLARSQSDAAAKAGLGLYQGERANQFAAMGMLPSFQAMDYQDLQAQAQAGAGRDAYSQALLDDQNAKYEYGNTAQLDWYNRLAQSLQGMYPGGQTVGQQSGSQWGTGGGGGGGSDQTGQLIGGGIAAAGTIAAAFI